VKTTGWLKSLLILGSLLPAWATASAAPVRGARGGLQEVPANAPLVVHVRGVDGTVERAFRLAKQVVGDNPQLAGWEEIVKDFSKNGKEGRKVRGATKDGPLFLVFTEMPKPGQQGPPEMAVIVGITKYSELLDNMLTQDERKALKPGEGYEGTTFENQPIFFIDHRDYAVLTPSETVAKRLAKTGEGLDGKISKELGAKLLSSDIGVYVNMDMVNKDYADQIKAGKAMAEAGLKTSIENAGQAEKAQMELALKAIGPLFQAVEDSQGVLLSFEIRPTGLAMHLQSEFRPTSPTGKLLSLSKVASLKEIEDLPGGQMIYSGFQYSPMLVKIMGGLLYGVLPGGEGPEGKEAQAALEALWKANPGTLVGSASIPPTGLQAWTYEEPRKAVTAQIKMIQSLTTGNTYLSGMLKEKPVIKVGAQKHGGFEFTSVKMVWDLEKMMGKAGENLPEDAKKKMIEAFKKLVGDSANIWYGTDGKRVVQITAGDWAGAEKILDAYLKQDRPVGGEGNFRAVRKELPAETSIVGMIDLVQYGAAMLDYMKALMEPNLPWPKNYPPAPPKAKPGFIGQAVTMQGDRASMDLFLSLQAMKNTYEAFVLPLLAPTP
jgi:hypothetical protein